LDTSTRRLGSSHYGGRAVAGQLFSRTVR
jgi:DNA-binding transcriptional LysR family regulator